MGRCVGRCVGRDRDGECCKVLSRAVAGVVVTRNAYFLYSSWISLFSCSLAALISLDISARAARIC